MELGVSKSSVHDLLASESVRRKENERGRPRKIQEKELEDLVAEATKNWQGRQLSWDALGTACGLQCSGLTIRRAMHEIGYKKCKACKHPYISEPARIKRLHWESLYGTYQTPQWSDWRFSDEVTFTSGTQATAWVIQTTKERHSPECTQNTYRSGRSSFACFGMIGENYKSPLVFIDGHGKSGGMNQEDYASQVLKAIVGPHFKETFEKTGRQLTLYEDGNSAHGFAKPTAPNPAKSMKDKWEITRVQAPPSSPDFNPIEKVWRWIKSKLKQRVIRGIAEMKKAVQELWDQLDPYDFNKYWQSMPDRLRQCKERNGLATTY